MGEGGADYLKANIGRPYNGNRQDKLRLKGIYRQKGSCMCGQLDKFRGW